MSFRLFLETQNLQVRPYTAKDEADVLGLFRRTDTWYRMTPWLEGNNQKTIVSAGRHWAAPMPPAAGHDRELIHAIAFSYPRQHALSTMSIVADDVQSAVMLLAYLNQQTPLHYLTFKMDDKVIGQAVKQMGVFKTEAGGNGEVLATYPAVTNMSDPDLKTATGGSHDQKLSSLVAGIRRLGGGTPG